MMAGRTQRRIASRYTETRGSRSDVLLERSRRVIQRAAAADIAPADRAQITGRSAFRLSLSTVAAVGGEREAEVLASSRSLAAAWNRIVERLAERITRRATELSRPTRDTGLFMSSWRVRTVGRGGPLKTAVEVSNPTPYAGYVHRRGERGRTVVRTYIEPMIREEIARWRNELPLLTRVIRARILETLTGRL